MTFELCGAILSALFGAVRLCQPNDEALRGDFDNLLGYCVQQFDPVRERAREAPEILLVLPGGFGHREQL